jgi:hypothetical protein
VNGSKVPKARISSYEAILKGNVVDGGVEDTVPLWEHRPHPTQRRDLSSFLSRLRHPKSLSTPTRSSRLVIPRKFLRRPPPERRTGSHYKHFGLLIHASSGRAADPQAAEARYCQDGQPSGNSEFRPLLYFKQVDSLLCIFHSFSSVHCSFFTRPYFIARLHSQRLSDYKSFLTALPTACRMDESLAPRERIGNTGTESNKYDIVIIGAGPVGLLLSTCLARWGYKIKHIDNRPEPTKTGRADGIQPRSLDLLRNMGLKPAIMAHKPAKVYEVAFWDPIPTAKGIHRTGTWASCPSFIDARYPFTTLLHQGLIERVFIADLEKNGVQIQRPWTITGFKTDETIDTEFPVEVNLEHVEGRAKETVRAKYLFSGEGARSFVREQLKIGIKHKDPIAHVWGVMDGVVETDFPDIKVSILGETTRLQL